ncbi:Hsp20/alpha crystallin family protein [Candidatus Peregrinibacteria bacterium CG_4_10_14_0_2_um_filter_38_24]|nr:MAG: Hsp20/alpha crystallin family protein [Candidatus Peregrinibacteria bacterium CG_4_10_14_0_2_um_filter_38_24]PJC38676.1 MAG: Hsp20/alpha crystallin family protein [Candidatus Peregrinibacteria bacterium CG_4_9_14_0_2_um_filter_38_9]
MKNSSIKIHPADGSETPLKKEVGQLSLDIYQTDKEIIVVAPIAGVEKEDINITVNEDILVIKGDRAPRDQVADENYYTKECFWGSFSRAIVLPKNADIKNISASFEKCVLEIRIPKAETEANKIIKIKS